ncbi:iron-containing alcohol dehydrogenase [Oceanobacillus jeddahense]|uniref:Iron-containing alcohol dehydrogenase n=1 Tax=Oceanobacillus jeddahense TaxID=1462527 RepID=A0ABY5JRL8_9BACI|nr:iron-containing alcohol dehydrogenase [Oceanobacillus jeddahense]UUI02972.1 iron-containing alcohol dehydrogenase [Oceanobacillus jeddahense]
MGNLYQFQTANHIISGKDSIKQISDHLKILNIEIRNILMIAQPSMIKHGFVDHIQQQLEKENIKADINTDILPEPTANNINEVFQSISANEYDALIGIGGGSVLDATKILSVMFTNAGSIEDKLGTDLVKNKGIPTVLIPSTAGTGSEVTPNAIVTLPDEELKIGMVSKYLLPNLVILDPVLTLSLPKHITAATGMDAFTHAFESFISNKANLISDMFALESIRLISDSIVEAYENGSNIEAREKMLVGSMYGGMALTSAGTAAVHALAYPLGGKFNISHGVANSMLLPYVTEFNLDSIRNKMHAVADAMKMDTANLSEDEAARAVIDKIREWTEVLEIPQNLKSYGVSESHLKEISIAASKVTRLLNNNPKEMSLRDIEEVYRKLLEE